MTNTLAKLLTAIIACLVISCDKPECKNINPVFDANAPEMEVYKAELEKKLNSVNLAKLRYWIHSYKESNRQHYILIDITGDGLCATAEMAISANDRQLRNFIEVKGGGYHGAELIGLKYNITKDISGTHFIFKGIDAIYD